MVSRDIPFEEKVDAFTEKRGPDACWPWSGPMHKGRPYIRSKSVLLFVYQRAYGTVPMGFMVVRTDHELACPRDCVHTRCVNPAHLEMVVNSGGPGRRRQTLCLRGHDMTDPDNVYEWKGLRQCRKCRNIYSNQWQKQHPEVVRKARNARRKKKKDERKADQEVMAERESS